MFDDDERILSLTEAETITGATHSDGDFVRKCVSKRLLALSEGDIAALTTAMRQVGVGSQGCLRPWQSFTS